MIVVGGATHSQSLLAQKRNLFPMLQNLWDKPVTIAYKDPALNNMSYQPLLAADFYSRRLSFFCKQEIKMDRLTKLPFRFRLGGVEQVNWLEGKKGRF